MRLANPILLQFLISIAVWTGATLIHLGRYSQDPVSAYYGIEDLANVCCAGVAVAAVVLSVGFRRSWIALFCWSLVGWVAASLCQSPTSMTSAQRRRLILDSQWYGWSDASVYFGLFAAGVCFGLLRGRPTPRTNSPQVE